MTRAPIVGVLALLHCGPVHAGAPEACPPSTSPQETKEAAVGPYYLNAREVLDLLARANILDSFETGLGGSRCVDTEGCFVYGRCGLPNGECGVYSDLDCLYSRVCYRYGACARVVGTDGVANCAGIAPAFIEVGLLGTEPNHHFDAFDLSQCTGDAESCPASGPLHCRHSPWCIKYGKCYYTDGKCHAKTDIACKASAGCKNSGNCVFNGAICAERSEAPKRAPSANE